MHIPMLGNDKGDDSAVGTMTLIIVQKSELFLKYNLLLRTKLMMMETINTMII